VEIRIVDEAGRDLPHDGASAGTLMVRGPWVIRRYYRAESDATDADGWFDTGDVATLDEHGFLRITDRAKDLIKSGGEWISSIALENVAAACPGVKIAAAVGVSHPKWEERPLLVVELHEGKTLTSEQMIAHLAPQIPKWWMPDAIEVVESIPLTSTGKIDKKALCEHYRDHFGMLR
jgi:acyl-CoA synthetase (AMP-forming)/AMP-acid ligase II